MKILVIEDDDVIRSIIRVSLSEIGGLEVVEANRGEVGITIAQSEKPDAILLDVMMPVMDGVSTMAALRSEASTKDIPIVFLTAKVLKSEVDRLKELGAVGVLVKPFDPRELPGALKNLLATP
jgi:CheY-like chemotaxis protein